MVLESWKSSYAVRRQGLDGYSTWRYAFFYSHCREQCAYQISVFITIAPTYCAEIAPFALRGAVTSAVNWSIVFGQCLAYVVMRQTQYSNGPNAYRILFGIQWVFAGVALIILPWFPESPYQLVAQGMMDKARENTKRLYNKNFDVDGFMASVKTDLETQLQTQNEASFKECFQGTNKLRTLIVRTPFISQVLTLSCPRS